MFQKANESRYLESTSMIFFLLKWKKPISLVAILALIGSCIFSSPTFIAPKYKSSVVFFPAATNSISKALLDENTSEKQDILAFGEEEEAEQMLQILNSDGIRAYIVNKYNLMEHYKINASDPFPFTQLYEAYEDNITFHRTEFISVRIDVLDTDAQMAADIANDIALMADSMKINIQRSRAAEALVIVGNEFEQKLKAINKKEDSLVVIRQKGVIDYRNQALAFNEELAKAYSAKSYEQAMLAAFNQTKSADDTMLQNTKARAAGATQRVALLENKIKLLADYGGASISLSEQLTLEREELSKIKLKYDQLKVDAQQALPQKFLVNKAMKAERKYYPVRWLIVLVSTIGAIILSIVIILILEQIRKFKTYHVQ
ncbi:MAG: hypothetical protein RIQ89_2249 [Bacteroidota bacterium]|jgi:hypothetical protein